MSKIQIPCKYPALRVSKNDKQIRRLANYFLRLLPEPGSPKFDKLRKEIAQLSTINCWYMEYSIAKFLIANCTEYQDLEVCDEVIGEPVWELTVRELTKGAKAE